jgi:outer membrane protein TolC
LSQVRNGNEEWKSNNLASIGALDRATESVSLLSPTLLANAMYTRNERETFTPSFQGDRTDTQHYKIGISQLTTYGTKAEVGYLWGTTSIYGTNPTFVTLPTYRDASPYIEISQDLWRNGFGAEVRAIQVQALSLARATHYRETFRNKQIIYDAEMAYWRLLLAQENLSIQSDSLKRSVKLRDWNAKQMKMQLSDRSDYLQTVASLESRNLDFEQAKNDYASAARNFNTLRGMDSETVAENLAVAEVANFSLFIPPTKMTDREDVLEAKELAQVARANAEIGHEKNLPKVELFGNAALNGRDPTYDTAFDESLTNNYPAYTIGLRVTAVLDWDNPRRARRGHDYDKQSAQLEYSNKQFQQARLWKDLNLKFVELQKRLKLAQSAENAQKEKVNYERTRHQKGRSTIYQVLQFEQDFANSQITRIRIQDQLINVYTALKMFGEQSL